MKFGVFYQVPCGPEQSVAQRYQDTLEQIELADELGFDRAWIAELHFRGTFSVMPSPLMLAAVAAQRTKRIRLGIAVNLLPLHHPVNLAEDAATCDVLSGGRLEFGIGRGTRLAHHGFGVPQEDSRPRFMEALDILKRVWTEDNVTHKGKFWEINDVSVAPKPTQKPYPPLRMASNSADTFPLAGELGLPVFTWILINPLPRLQEGLITYRHVLNANGHPDQEVSLAMPVFVHEDGSKAQALAKTSTMSYMREVDAILGPGPRPTDETAAAGGPRYPNYLSIPYEDILQNTAAYDEPSAVEERLHKVSHALRNDETICWFNLGGLVPHEEVKKSMRLFAEKVMPNLH